MQLVAVESHEHALWHSLHIEALLEVFEQQFGTENGLAECHAMAQTMWDNCRDDAHWIYEDDQLCGAVVMKDVEGVDFVLDFFILTPHRGQGLGTQVIQQLQNNSSNRHVPLLLEVFPNNAEAIAFYRSQGFIPAGQRPPHHLQLMWHSIQTSSQIAG